MSILFKLFTRPRLNRKLRVAVAQGDLEQTRELLALGASADQTELDELSERSLVGSAVVGNDVNLVTALLEGKPDLERPTGDMNLTPLGEAVNAGYADIVNLLLAHGANPLTPSSIDARLSPLLLGLQHDNQAMAEAMLVHVQDLGMQSDHDLRCLETAIVAASADNVVNLLGKCSDESLRYMLGKVWMIEAAGQGRTAVVRALIESGIDYNLATELRKPDGPSLDQEVDARGHHETAALLREMDSGRDISPAAPLEATPDTAELANTVFVERMATHRDRIDQFSPEHRPFTIDHFDDQMISSLADLARDKMQCSLDDASVHSISITSAESAYAIYTMPFSLSQAAQWFADEYGGYRPFLQRLQEVPAHSSAHPGLLVHLIFGQAPGDQDLWFTMTVLPVDSEQHRFQPLLATDLLTPDELAELSDRMTTH